MTRTAADAGSRPHWLLNLLAFQAAWLATVLGAANGAEWLGPAAVAAVVALHLRVTADAAAEGRLLLLALAVGSVAEHALLWFGMIRYPGAPSLVPLWMLLLWPLFATTLNYSLAWFRMHLPAAAVFGAVGGPLAYRGGAALGAIEFPHELISMAAVGAVWIIAFPLLLVAARHLRSDRAGGGRA